SYFHMHWPSRYADEFLALPDSQKMSAVFDLTANIYTGPDPSGERLRDSYRYQTNVGLTKYVDDLIGGNHQIKTGIENWYGWGTDRFDVYNDTLLAFRNGAPAEVWAYNTPLDQKTHMKNVAAFLQDRISYSRFTVNLGVRYAHYDG